MMLGHQPILQVVAGGTLAARDNDKLVRTLYIRRFAAERLALPAKGRDCRLRVSRLAAVRQRSSHPGIREALRLPTPARHQSTPQSTRQGFGLWAGGNRLRGPGMSKPSCIHWGMK
jgi:hypothetical protein